MIENRSKTYMKQLTAMVLATFVLALGSAAHADLIRYEVRSDYQKDGFSASWMHGADGCTGTGPNSGDTLFMCGDPLLAISGVIEGQLVDGLLTITGGVLNVGGTHYDVYEGQMGAFGGDAVWGINIEHFGEFLFESFSMGSGMPNYFDGHTMILWGQNLDAYAFNPGFLDDRRWGIDLYAVQVPEPGTLSLLALGLFGMAVAARRRRIACTAASPI
jgi:hypothetical protein